MQHNVQTHALAFISLLLVACGTDGNSESNVDGAMPMGPPSGSGGAMQPDNNPGSGGSPSSGTGGETAMGGAGGADEGGQSDDGNAPSGPSAGCGKPLTDPTNYNVQHDISINGAARRYWTRLPEGYNPETQYPVVFYGPGCGGSNVEGTPVDGSVQGKAIFVFLLYTSGCFATGVENSPEIPYFGKALEEVQNNYCTDTGKVFVSGYSSGGWLSNLLACAHGDKIRAIGTAAGGLTKHHPECKGNVAAIMHAGTQDTANPIVNVDSATGFDQGSGAARDRLLAVNGCSAQSEPWDPQWPFCRVYQGCKEGYPVVWCEEDTGHSNGGTVTSQGFWKFWSALP